MDRIFVATPLDFETRTLVEMKAAWPQLLGKDAKVHSLPFPEVQIVQGGLEFETDRFAALQLNFFLKNANRVLLRLATFKARDLPKFYQNFKALPWREFLYHSNVSWEVAAQKSRLNNEKRLQESAEKALLEIFGSTVAGIPCATIYVRMDNDLCTISLDTTGDHLHKRGWSVLKGEAPLRETIAAYLLQELIADTSAEELAKVSLLDPMMGAGTFLTEARSLKNGQFARPFAFQKWKSTPKLFQSPSFAFNYKHFSELTFKKYLGFDIDEDMTDTASKNFAEVEKQLQSVQKTSFQTATLEVRTQDAFLGEGVPESPLWVVVNPPYGERLANSVEDGINGLAELFCHKYQPKKLGILYPEKDRLRIVPSGYRKIKELKVNNGGIRCLFTIIGK